MRNKYKNFAISALIAFVALGCSKNDLVYKEVAKASEEMNKQCPMVIDADTRLDNTMVTDNPVKLTYNYTVVTVEKKTNEPQINTVKEAMMKTTQNSVDTNPQMKFYRENKVPLTYSYKDKNGDFLFDFTVTPQNTTK